MSIDLDRDSYDAATVQARGAVLVDFWGPQCKPCLALMPAVEKLETEYAGRLSMARVNSVGNRMLCARLRVFGLPTFILYKDGVEAQRLTGEDITAVQIREAIERTLA